MIIIIFDEYAIYKYITNTYNNNIILFTNKAYYSGYLVLNKLGSGYMWYTI